jgi:hypothetical protein
MGQKTHIIENKIMSSCFWIMLMGFLGYMASLDDPKPYGEIIKGK